MPSALVILAAGQGTRMNSDIAKVLHPIGGVPMLAHAIAAGRTIEPERIIVVTGHGAAEVEAAVTVMAPDATCVRQTKQLGTGHAVQQAAEALDGFEGDVVVLYGDTPFIAPGTIANMLDARKVHDIVALGFHSVDPDRYGRLLMEGDRLIRIVEAKDATPEQLAIGFCNSGMLCVDAQVLLRLLGQVSPNNAAGEYYLTDIPQLAAAEGLSATAITCAEAETLGINTRAELVRAEAVFQATRRSEMLGDGVTMTAPDTVFLAFDTYIGRDSMIDPNVVFGPGVTVESGAHIRAFSHLEGCHIGAGAVVGPYARLRPGTELGNGARIGNFVEVKEALIGEGAKVNHLSYIGNASIGDAANIGAGTITCNYDGVMKHQTTIGARAFIGSNTMLVAPVAVGDDAMTASGSVITENVPAEALAVARARQINKPGLAVRLMARLQALKTSKREH